MKTLLLLLMRRYNYTIKNKIRFDQIHYDFKNRNRKFIFDLESEMGFKHCEAVMSILSLSMCDRNDNVEVVICVWLITVTSLTSLACRFLPSWHIYFLLFQITWLQASLPFLADYNVAET